MTAPISSLVQDLRMDAEMLKGGFLKNLTELWHSDVVRDAAKNALAAAARIEELEAALRGNDPEMPEPITPLGWLKTMIDECRRIAPELPEDADPSSWYEMINEVQELHDRARTLLQSKGEK